MNKTKLEVIKINEDVITTSGSLCDNSYYYVKLDSVGSALETKYNSSKFSSIESLSSWIMQHMLDLIEVSSNPSNNSKSFHMFEDGSFEVCTNPSEHNNSNWKNME